MSDVELDGRWGFSGKTGFLGGSVCCDGIPTLPGSVEHACDAKISVVELGGLAVIGGELFGNEELLCDVELLEFVEVVTGILVLTRAVELLGCADVVVSVEMAKFDDCELDDVSDTLASPTGLASVVTDALFFGRHFRFFLGLPLGLLDCSTLFCLENFVSSVVLSFKVFAFILCSQFSVPDSACLRFF